jgi:hypothetical protein
MKANKNRKTSPALQDVANPGPAKNARAYRIINESGLENQSMPPTRGSATTDQSSTEKQNQ